MNIDEIQRRLVAEGIATIDGFDRQRLLDTIREQRRRYAHDPTYAALGTAADLVRRSMRDGNPDLDLAAASDTLLAVASLLGTLVAMGMHATALVNVLAYLGDDMAKEVGPKAAEHPGSVWDCRRPECFDEACGDCIDGRCHGSGPCGCARHAASVQARQRHEQDGGEAGC